MKKMIAIALALLLALTGALAFAADDDPTRINAAVEITGDFDQPALINPEERYEHFVSKTDGSEYPIFVLLDGMNDEAADIEQHGALYITENHSLNSEGKPSLQLKMAIQDSPYGKVITSETQFLWMKQYVYMINDKSFAYDGKNVTQSEGYAQEEFDFYCESYHFPYGSLEVLNGVRQDENGYMYFFIQSDDDMSFEFVIGENMRILQLRLYVKNSDGQLGLMSYVDYDVGPAWEIPQIVLDAMADAGLQEA